MNSPITASLGNTLSTKEAVNWALGENYSSIELNFNNHEAFGLLVWKMEGDALSLKQQDMCNRIYLAGANDLVAQYTDEEGRVYVISAVWNKDAGEFGFIHKDK